MASTPYIQANLAEAAGELALCLKVSEAGASLSKAIDSRCRLDVRMLLHGSEVLVLVRDQQSESGGRDKAVLSDRSDMDAAWRTSHRVTELGNDADS